VKRICGWMPAEFHATGLYGDKIQQFFFAVPSKGLARLAALGIRGRDRHVKTWLIASMNYKKLSASELAPARPEMASM